MSTDVHDLHERMDRALAALDVPTDRIRAGAITRGRAVRRRRRAAGVLGGAAAVALAAAIALPSLAGTDDAAQRIAQDSGDPSPSPETSVRPAGWWDMPGSTMIDTLRELLPPTATVVDLNLGDEDLAPGEEPAGGWAAADVVVDGESAGGVNVVLYPPFETSSFAEDVTTCPGNAADAASCTELREDDEVGRVVRYVTQDVVTLETTWLLPDGGVVYAAVSNSADDKWGAGSSVERPGLPLRPAQLRAIAQSPLWQDHEPRG